MLGIYIDKSLLVAIVILIMVTLVTLHSLKRFLRSVDDIEDRYARFIMRLMEFCFVGSLWIAAVVFFIVYIYQGRLTIFWLS